MTGTSSPRVPNRPGGRWPSLGDAYIAPPIGPSDRKFGFTVGGVLAAIAAFSAWRGHVVRAEATAAIGIALIVAATVRPASLTRLSAAWSKLGHALGWFNSRVLLGVMFFLVLTPVGLVSRMFGSDPLDRRRRGGSFWTDYSKRVSDAKHYERLS